MLLPPYFDLPVAPLAFPQPLPAGASSARVFHPPSAAARTMFIKSWGYSSGADNQFIIGVTKGDATSATLDASALNLPEINSAATFSGKVVSWTQSSIERVDLRAVTAISSFSKNGKLTTVNWTVYSGSNVAHEELPGLPAMFADIDPTQQLSSTPLSASVTYANYSNVTSYDDVRRRSFEGMVSLPAFPAMGDEVYQARLSRSH